MTPEEKRQFEELQLKTENRFNFLVEHHADLDAKIEQIQIQAQEDRQVMKAAINEMQEVTTEMRNAVAEMRYGFGKLIEFSEELKQHVKTLYQLHGTANRQIDNLKDRVDKLENS